MKRGNLTSFNAHFSAITALFISILFTACAGQQDKGGVVFRPDASNNPRQQSMIFESWEITNTQNGDGGAPSGDIPDWVRWYVDNDVNKIEALDRFNGKYIFVGENGGYIFNALQQWVNGYAVEQDLPRLITRRVEQRLISSATLYPDNEYGEYFEFLIRDVSNEEFSGAVREETFWLKRKINNSSETDDDLSLQTSQDLQERYEFFILISIDKGTLQKQLQSIINGVKTKVPATKEQAAAITKVKKTFFEGF